MSRVVVAIIQARCGSTRLPGKVLELIGGKPMLVRVIERAGAIAGVDVVGIATSTDPSDQAVADIALAAGVPVFRGSNRDVLSRYAGAAREWGAEVIVRLTADCPLLDPLVSARVVQRYLVGDVDYASNVHPPTYPDGLDTEVFSFDVLEQAATNAVLTSEREHVTPYIWKNEVFTKANIESPTDLSHLRWTVDDAADLDFVRAIYAELGSEMCSTEEVLAVLQNNPSMRRGGAARNEGYAESLRHDRTVD